MKNKKEAFAEEALNKQFEIAGHGITIEDVKDSLTWFTDFTITLEEETAFREWFITEVVRRRLCTKRKAKETYAWFSLMYGLTLKNE